MCGIIGIITGETTKEALTRRRYMEDALIIDTVRGKDSTGMFLCPHSYSDGENKSPYWSKQVADGPTFVKSRWFLDYFEPGMTQDYKFMVGHNRAATVGGVTVEAAHPFHEGPITLVHNGTLTSTIDLKLSQHEAKAVNDSHTICHNLAIQDPEEVIKNLNGAFTLVWHDARDDSLNMVRNTRRPMHLAKAKNSDSIYFASEGEMLKWLDRRLRLDIGPIASLKPAHWLKFNPSDIMNPVCKEVELFTYKNWNTKHKSYGSTSHNHGSKVVDKRSSSYYHDKYQKDLLARTAELSPDNIKIHDQRIKIGGRKRQIPEALKMELMDLDIDTGVYYSFIATRGEKCMWHRTSKYTHTVYGCILDNKDERSFLTILHGVPPQAWNLCTDRVWKVRITGMMWGDVDQPILIGQYCDVVNRVGRIQYVEGRRPVYLEQEEEKEEEDEKPTETLCGCYGNYVCYQHRMYQGPHGAELTAEEFLNAVSGGCVFCNRPINMTDCDDIDWVNNSHDPCCFDCLDAVNDNVDISSSSSLDLSGDDDDEAPWLH
jgi:hypothetical protein